MANTRMKPCPHCEMNTIMAYKGVSYEDIVVKSLGPDADQGFWCHEWAGKCPNPKCGELVVELINIPGYKKDNPPALK